MSALQERDTVEPFAPEGPGDGLYRSTPPHIPPARRSTRRVGFVGPSLLIGAGILLLLNNLGIVAWDTWLVLWRLWPVILIAVGLDILIGRRSLLTSALVAVALIVVLLGGTLLLASGMTSAGQETIAQPRSGATSASITIGPAVANLRIAAASDTTMLVGGTVDRLRGETLRQEAQGTNGAVTYVLESRAVRGLPFGATPPGGDPAIWDLRLGRDVPIALKVSTGIGQATLDLTGLQLTNLDVSSGVGQTIITLPGQGRFSAKVDAGVGEVIVRVPTGMAARIHVNSGLGSVDMPTGYARQGDWYVSPGYDTAANRIDLDINGGVGRIAVQEIGGR